MQEMNLFNGLHLLTFPHPMQEGFPHAMQEMNLFKDLLMREPKRGMQEVLSEHAGTFRSEPDFSGL